MTRRIATCEIAPAHDALQVTFDDGTQASFASLWLRDNLSEDRDPHSGQRLIDVADLPEAPLIREFGLGDGHLTVRWSDTAAATGTFLASWLFAQARPATVPERAVRRWRDGAALDARRDFAWLEFGPLQQDGPARLSWLVRLAQDGVAFLCGVPAVESGLLSAMAQVGRVQETNYGQVFDVRAVPQPENLAYSDRGLGLHTDNPYREPVPGFQALHTLLAAPDGGDSLVADGFALAEHLQAIDPESYECLCRTPVPFRYRAERAELYAERPLIHRDVSGQVTAVHYNSRSIAPFTPELQACRAFYAAYRRFAQLLREARFQAVLRLAAGEIMVFDNQRILHGRTGFASQAHPRHLRGCYLTRDSVYSEIGLLRRQYASENS